jgi:hypothetical protein
MTFLMAQCNGRMAMELHDRFLEQDLNAIATQMLESAGLGDRVYSNYSLKIPSFRCKDLIYGTLGERRHRVFVDTAFSFYALFSDGLHLKRASLFGVRETKILIV